MQDKYFILRPIDALGESEKLKPGIDTDSQANGEEHYITYPLDNLCCSQ